VGTLTFGQIQAAQSGVVNGIVCGCAWKGSNIYGHTNGKIYMSKTNDYTSVLWDGVTLTNDIGSSDLGPARTAVLADDTVGYPRLLIPAENLYCITDREVYVFIAGNTAATSSFARKIDGARGTVGIRAGCNYGSDVLYGAVDGLWMTKKSSDYGVQPDELIEVTKQNRTQWLALLGSSPSTLVVRQHLGEIWCFNGSSYLHFNRLGRQIYGEWADGANVIDAVSVPYLGMILQLSDGSLGVIGSYPTDGGADLLGQNGTPVNWSYTTGRRWDPCFIERVSAHWGNGQGVQSNITIQVQTENGQGSVSLQSVGDSACNLPFSRIDNTNQPVRGAWWEATVSGVGADQVYTIEIDAQAKSVPRTQGS
jgi:hypothetical protein